MRQTRVETWRQNPRFTFQWYTWRGHNWVMVRRKRVLTRNGFSLFSIPWMMCFLKSMITTLVLAGKFHNPSWHQDNFWQNIFMYCFICFRHQELNYNIILTFWVVFTKITLCLWFSWRCIPQLTLANQLDTVSFLMYFCRKVLFVTISLSLLIFCCTVSSRL